MQAEYFMIPLILGQVSTIIAKFNTGNCFIDVFGLIMCFMIYKTVNLKNTIKYLQKQIGKRKNKYTVVVQSSKCNSEEEECSIKFRAAMHYISSNVKTIYKVKEIHKTEYGGDGVTKELESGYMVCQSAEIKINENLFGMVVSDSVEQNRPGGGTSKMVITNLKIYTYTMTMQYVQEWVNRIEKEYIQHVKESSIGSQMYISLSGKDAKSTKSGGDKKISDLQILAVTWESSIRFDNSYFRDMEETIKKIDFFLNNKQWYIEKGIPYNLGIMLYGEPGCGKTRFIKQLANHTKRHIVDIKMSDITTQKDLYNIMCKEEIGENFIIPINKRILVFEDIDAMGKCVKSRDLADNDKEQEKSAILNTLTNNANGIGLLGAQCLNQQDNGTTLSYMLNIFDGINETSGRIIIITTNKPDVLDPALIRPGRIDLKILFEKCNLCDIKNLINKFWDKDIEEDMILPNIHMQYTSAEVYSIFRISDNFDEIKSKFLKADL
jgi:ATP-dependent 26S proteasome regulatory subunit